MHIEELTCRVRRFGIHSVASARVAALQGATLAAGPREAA